MKKNPIQFSNRTLRAFLFDLDGTLVDASELIVRSFNFAMIENGLPPVDPSVIRRTIGQPLRQVLKDFGNRVPLDRLVNSYRTEFFRLSPAGTRLLPGAADLLVRLAREVPLGIVTSRSSNGTRQLLRHFFFEHYFGTIVGADDVSECKPAPEPLFRALGDLQVAPARAALIGDTSHDMLAARAAGVLALGVCTGPFSRRELLESGADCVFRDLVEVDRAIFGGRDWIINPDITSSR